VGRFPASYRRQPNRIQYTSRELNFSDSVWLIEKRGQIKIATDLHAAHSAGRQSRNLREMCLTLERMVPVIVAG